MAGTLDGVEVFIEVVESGGFSRAAERLALTRSAVGKTVARLESRLGVKLFNRTTRSHALTDEGHIYYARALRARAELRAAEQLFDSGRQEVSGRLRISMPHLFGLYCVVPILLEMAERYPALELDLSFSDEIVDVIAEGFDLAIRNGRLGEGSGLRGRKVATQQKLLCAAPTYIARRGRPAGISDLAKHETLVYRRHGQDFPWTMQGPDGALVEVPLSGRLHFDSQLAIKEAAIFGTGLAWLPRWLVKDSLASGELVALLEGVMSASLDTYAIWPETDYPPLRLRMVIDQLAHGLPIQTAGLNPSANP